MSTIFDHSTGAITFTGAHAFSFDDLQAAGIRFSKHADPTEDARGDLSRDEAEEIAAEDPSPIYITISPETVDEPTYQLALAVIGR